MGERISGRVLPGVVSGRPCYFNKKVDELYTFLLNFAKVSYPRSRKEVMAIVQVACSKKGLNALGVFFSHRVGFADNCKLITSSQQCFYCRHNTFLLQDKMGFRMNHARLRWECPSTFFDLQEDLRLSAIPCYAEMCI